MKKLFTSLLLLVAGATLNMVHAYDLWVGDKQVTTDNYNNIKPTGLTSGKIWCDINTNELYLEDVVYNGSSSFVFNKGIENLTIYVKGTCSITCTAGNGFRLQKKTTIRGYWVGQTLNVKCTDTENGYSGIWVDGDISVNLLWLFADIQAQYPIHGTFGSYTNKKLYIDACQIRAKSTTSTNAIGSLNTVYLYDNVFYEGGCKFNGTNVVTSSGATASDVTINPYLCVGNYIVRNYSSEDISGSNAKPAGNTEGTITWDKSTKTLTFTGVKQSCSNRYNICNRMDGLNVVFSGSNTLTNTGSDVIYSNKSITFKGNNPSNDIATITCNRESNAYYGIWLPGSNAKQLSFSNVGFYVTAQKNSIYSSSQIDTISIYRSNIVATTRTTDTDAKAIYGFSECSMSGSDVLLPTGCCYRKSLKGFGTTSELSNYVMISKYSTTYPVTILGNKLNNINVANMAFDGVTGTLSYDQNTKTLGLDNVTIKSPDGNSRPAIESSAQNLIVTLTGSNSITSAAECIVLRDTTVINGSGYLTIKSTESDCFSVYGKSVITLNTTNAIITEAARYGYYGSSNDKLVLKKTSSDTDQYNFAGISGAIHNLGELSLSGMDFDNNRYSAQKVGLYFADKEIRKNGGETVKDRYGVSFSSIKESLGVTVAGVALNRVASSTSTPIYIGSPFLNYASGQSVASYVPSTKTLTLNNATISGGNLKMGDAASGAIINLTGTNTINTDYNYALDMYGSTTINGSDKNTLTVNTSGYDGLYLNENATLTIKGAQLTAKGANYGGFLANGTTLTINGAQVCFGDEQNTSYGLGRRNSADGEGGTLKITNSGAVKAMGKTWAFLGLKGVQRDADIYVTRPTNGNITQSGSGYGVYVNSKIASTAVISNGKSIFDKMKGDVNNDGEITMADAYAVVSYYLATTKPANFDVTLADMTNDGEITMADAYAIVVIYLESNK